MKTMFARKILVMFFSTITIGGAALLALNAYTAPPQQVAYAHVLGNGTLDTANSKGVVAMGGGNGLYCFKLAFQPKNAVVTLADDPAAPDQGVGFIKVAVPPTPLFTCATIPKPDAVVETDTETLVNAGKSAGGFAFYVHWTR